MPHSRTLCCKSILAKRASFGRPGPESALIEALRHKLPRHTSPNTLTLRPAVLASYTIQSLLATHRCRCKPGMQGLMFFLNTWAWACPAIRPSRPCNFLGTIQATYANAPSPMPRASDEKRRQSRAKPASSFMGTGSSQLLLERSFLCGGHVARMRPTLGLRQVLNLFARQQFDFGAHWHVVATEGFWQSCLRAWSFSKYPRFFINVGS